MNGPHPCKEVAEVIRGKGITFIVDAMSSFGGVPIDMKKLDIDFLVSSANKCIQGVPGFGFIIAKREKLMACKGVARSLSLDIYDRIFYPDKSQILSASELHRMR